MKDYSLLTETLVELYEYQAAIESAGKAGASSAWKAINKGCVLAGEFKLAQEAGLQGVVEANLILDAINLSIGVEVSRVD
jgi:hypothetical protein